MACMCMWLYKSAFSRNCDVHMLHTCGFRIRRSCMSSKDSMLICFLNLRFSMWCFSVRVSLERHFRIRNTRMLILSWMFRYGSRYLPLFLLETLDARLFVIRVLVRDTHVLLEYRIVEDNSSGRLFLQTNSLRIPRSFRYFCSKFHVKLENF